MAQKNIFKSFVNRLFKRLLSLPENKSKDINKPAKFLVVRQHNQLSELLAGGSLFRSIKETFPQSHITLVISPYNYPGSIKSRFIDRIFIFDKRKIFNPFYLIKFLNLLKDNYDVAIVPVVVSVSFVSNFIARISKSETRIGAESLDGEKNESAFFFDRRIKLDWRRHPDSNVSERSLDIVRPFGINTANFRSDITCDNDDIKEAEKFIAEMNLQKNEFLIGVHPGARMSQNRWSLEKYVALLKRLKENYQVKFYLTGNNRDKEEIKFIKENFPFDIYLFINKKIPEIAALISRSELFISNDTELMHVAGTTDTPQISIFGPTNPFNWAPIGKNKYFIRKSELIDDVSVQDVFDLCQILISGSRNEINVAR